MDDYNRIQEGEATKAVAKNFADYIFETPDDEDQITLEDLKELIDQVNKPTLLDAIAERLCELGFGCTANDTDKIIAEFKRRYKIRVGKNWAENAKAIEKWLKGGNFSVVNRKNNYIVCYVLEMNLKQTAEFFKKTFCSIPFNYKDTTDAIFYYAIKNGTPYQKIEEMMKKAKKFPLNEDCLIGTATIGEQIDNIHDDEEFARYLSLHCFNRQQQYQRAKKMIIDILNKPEYCNMDFKTLSEGMTGRSHSIKKLSGIDLPSEFVKDLPNNQTLGDIKSGKDETYDVLRRTLIVLLLFDFYGRYDENEIYYPIENDSRNNVLDDYADFKAETDEKLSECGLVQLYGRDLFDALILHCAYSTCPMRTFYGLIGTYYEDEN